MSETRKLAAILVADALGDSRLAGTDEDRTLARLRGLRSDLLDPAIAAHHGRLSPRDPYVGVFHVDVGDAEISLGHYDVAIEEYRKALDSGQLGFFVYTNLAAAYAHAAPPAGAASSSESAAAREAARWRSCATSSRPVSRRAGYRD